MGTQSPLDQGVERYKKQEYECNDKSSKQSRSWDEIYATRIVSSEERSGPLVTKSIHEKPFPAMIANASCHRRFEHQRAAVKNGLQNEESKDLLQPSLSFRFGLSVETTRCTERVKMLRNSVRAFRRLRTFNVHTRKLGKIAGSATNASEEKTATSKNAESNELKKRKTAEEVAQNEGAGKKESQGPSTRGHKEPTRYGDWEYKGRCFDF